MIRLGDVWINPAQILYAHDYPNEERLVLVFGGNASLPLRGADRVRALAMLRERQGGTLDDLRERAQAAAATLPRKEA